MLSVSTLACYGSDCFIREHKTRITKKAQGMALDYEKEELLWNLSFV